MTELVPASTDMLDTFSSFGMVHLLTVLFCTALLGAIAWLGRRVAGRPAEPRVRRTLAIIALVYWIAYNTWWNWGGFNPLTGIPLQACDISGLAAPFALLTRNRWLRATLYFWAFAFATQAFIQPTLTDGPAHLVFWAFWAAHTIILGCALYDLTALDFRPDWGDFARAATVALIWAAVVIAVDLRLGADYGYIGNPPAGTPIPPIVERFGPWPQRLVFMLGLAVLAFLLLLVPWLAVGRRSAGDAVAASPAVAEEQSA